jgi:archaellum component FlaC
MLAKHARLYKKITELEAEIERLKNDNKRLLKLIEKLLSAFPT